MRVSWLRVVATTGVASSVLVPYLGLVLSLSQSLARGADAPPAIEPAVQRVLDRISADSLRGHLSFLASDRLEGRGTPSKGLDLAAEYIAAQFRRAGLEPIGDDGYFQTADWPYHAPAPGSFACAIKLGGATMQIPESQVSAALTAALKLPPTTVFKIAATHADALKALTPEQVRGQVVLAEVPHPGRVARARAREANLARMAFFSRMAELKPALVVDVDRDPEGALGLRADAAGGRGSRPGASPSTPRITVHSPELARAFEALPAGHSEGTLALEVGEPKPQIAKVRNVVGLLRGSDPALANTYVLLSAHYDHLGVGARNEAGDRIFNGANDDASGTVSVVEIASALAGAGYRPRRSVVFLAFYGEEHGMVGSRYYAAHPVVPLAKTVAALNLEQLGRTDDTDGPRVAAATVTGLEYSDMGATLQRAGEAVGVQVGKHPVKSDAYFGASDNITFAREGIPAHTVSVAYDFPDYHGADDEWEKIDFPNLARVDRMVCLGLIKLADAPQPPAWNATHPQAARFAKTAAEKRGK